MQINRPNFDNIYLHSRLLIDYSQMYLLFYCKQNLYRFLIHEKHISIFHSLELRYRPNVRRIHFESLFRIGEGLHP